jgi:hypothetical protein
MVITVEVDLVARLLERTEPSAIRWMLEEWSAPVEVRHDEQGRANPVLQRHR